MIWPSLSIFSDAARIYCRYGLKCSFLFFSRFPLDQAGGACTHDMSMPFHVLSNAAKTTSASATTSSESINRSLQFSYVMPDSEKQCFGATEGTERFFSSVRFLKSVMCCLRSDDDTLFQYLSDAATTFSASPKVQRGGARTDSWLQWWTPRLRHRMHEAIRSL